MTNERPSPRTVIDAARTLIAADDARLAPVWPRAVAFLSRQALECALDQLWANNAHTESVADCPARTQLLCAFYYLDADLAGRLAWTWTSLSRACHIHAYDLAPTIAELTGWLTQVEELADLVAGAGAAAAP